MITRTVRKLRSPAVAYLLPALLVGLAVELGLRTMTLPRLARTLGVALETAQYQPARPSPLRRLGTRDAARYRAARRVLRLWPGGGENTCLRLALVAGFLLRQRRPTLHLGVAHRDGRTTAHAWIVVDGMVVDPLAGQFRPLMTTGS